MHFLFSALPIQPMQCSEYDCLVACPSSVWLHNLDFDKIQSQIQIQIQSQIQSQIHYVREYTECLLTHTVGGGSSIGGHSAIDSIFSTRPSAFTHICILYMCTKIFPYSHFSAFLTLLLADTYFAKNLEMWHFEFKVKLYTYALFCNNKKTKVFWI